MMRSWARRGEGSCSSFVGCGSRRGRGIAVRDVVVGSRIVDVVSVVGLRCMLRLVMVVVAMV